MIKKLFGAILVCICALPLLAGAQSDNEIVKARIVQIVSEETSTLEGFEIDTTTQVITVEFLEGDLIGSQQTFSQDKFVLEKGEIVFIEDQDGQYQILEKNRIPMIWSVVLLFIFLVVLLNGKQGIKSILGLVLSFIVIVFVMLPLVINGFNPLLVSVGVGVIVLASVLYLSHGFNKGSTIALFGTLGAIIFAGLLSIFISYWMRLTGLGDDLALSALVNTKGVIDFSDLLLAGIIVGMLGVLDDIAITQVAVVSEIKKANPNLSIKEIFTRALRVGKEHVSALVNTLVLAYVGASFPLLILLYQSGVRLDLLVSQEIVAAEIIRTLVGSIGLIIAVPLTTYFAAKFLPKDSHVESHCSHHH